MGLAPAVGVTATSAVPMRTGGNFDQRRLGKGATLYLPVEVGSGGEGEGRLSLVGSQLRRRGGTPLLPLPPPLLQARPAH